MNAGNNWATPWMLAELVGELGRGRVWRYARIARGLGLDRIEEQGAAARADWLSTGVVGDNHEVGTRWST
jgi:hypothetical protein